MRTTSHRNLLALLLALALAGAAVAADIPKRPEELKYPDLTFEVPDPDALRFELSNGIPVYLVEDHQFPLATVTVMFRGGSYLVPPERTGLAAVTAEAWRTGGAGELTAQQLDEELDFLAARLSTSIGDTTGSVRLNVLSKDLGKGLALLMDVLERPRFQEDRFTKAKDDLVQAMKRRNDDTADIEAREWQRLIYGPDYWQSLVPTAATVAAIDRDAAAAFVDRLVRADQIVVAAAGDVDRAALKAQLETTLGTLPKAETALPAVPQPEVRAEPGIYLVDKQDVNQGRVSIGHLGLKQGHPQEMDLQVMNDVLGGGGFTSWITKRVRSDEGLAYSAGSYMSFPVTVPGVFRAFFQTKSSTVAGASDITLELIEKMRQEGLSEEELQTSKSSFIETFPRRFESPEQTAATFASDELIGRPHSYWTTYRDRIAAVTTASAQAAARQHLEPSKMVILVVGKVDEILPGHPDYDADLKSMGTIHRLPLRDPMTQEPLAEAAQQ